MTLQATASSYSSCNESLLEYCLQSPSSLTVITVQAVLNLILLPLYLLVLFVGFKQWRQQRQQGALSGTGTSDVLTYNLVFAEIIGAVSAVSFAGSSWMNSSSALLTSYCLFVMYFFGEAAFHCGMCVDRYVAVVHPIAYRNQKEARAVRIRNRSIVVCWVGVVLWIPLVCKMFPDFPSKELVGVIIFFTVTVMYCCLSALYVLTRAGPNGKKQVDQTKLRAFHLISTITCLLLFKLIGILTYLCLFILKPLTQDQLCLILVSAVLIITPVNALIPLLFLCRRKQIFCSRG